MCKRIKFFHIKADLLIKEAVDFFGNVLLSEIFKLLAKRIIILMIILTMKYLSN